MKRAGRLDQLRIVTPCSVPWASMEGDDRVRFCGSCRKSVYNVAAMTREEAVARIERAEGRACVRLTRRTDGTIVTGDCWAVLRRARRRGLLALAAALPVVLLAQLWSQAFGLRALGGLFRQAPPPGALVDFRGGATLVQLPASPLLGAHALPPPHPPTRKPRKLPRRKASAESITMGGLVSSRDDDR